MIHVSNVGVLEIAVEAAADVICKEKLPDRMDRSQNAMWHVSLTSCYPQLFTKH
jgi:hypothetical protein